MTVPAIPTTPMTATKIAIIVLAAIGLISLLALVIFAAYQSGAATTKSVLEPVQTASPTAAPTPEPTTSVITFNAVYCTLASGKYQVITTDNRILDFRDYETWNSIVPHANYVGEERDGVVISAHLLGYTEPRYLVSYDNYPKYYHYRGEWYQYDGRRVDHVSEKQVRNERYYEGPPPGNPDRQTVGGYDTAVRITMGGY